MNGMNKTDSLLSIIVPIYNQGDFIESVVEDYVLALRKLGKPYEILLAPNGCQDNTLEICHDLVQKYKELRLVTLEMRGWGKTIKKAMQASKGDLICYVNSARNTGEDLLAILSKALANPGNLIQARREVRQNWARCFASLLFNWECRLLFGLPSRDVNGKPKAFPRSLEKLFELGSDDILFDLELAIASYQQNYPMIEVPITTWRRHGGKSTTTLWSALQLYLGPFQLKQRERKNERAFRLQKP